MYIKANAKYIHITENKFGVKLHIPNYTYNNSNDKQKKSDVHSRKNPHRNHEGLDRLTNSLDKVCAEKPHWLYFYRITHCKPTST